MQVMFTSSDGSILENSTSAGTMDNDDDAPTEYSTVRKVGAGEKITYLYR